MSCTRSGPIYIQNTTTIITTRTLPHSPAVFDVVIERVVSATLSPVTHEAPTPITKLSQHRSLLKYVTSFHTDPKQPLFNKTIHDAIMNRDVTKFEFEFDNVPTSNVFNKFEIRGMF